MLLIPAIDLKDGQCVRLRQGRMDDVTVFSEDPVAMAARWLEAGARRLHLVDLNGAFAGKPVNAQIIGRIAKAFPDLSIQVGGGIRDTNTVDAYLNVGVEFVIIGTKAVKEPDFVKTLCAKYPGHIIVGLDARNDKVAMEGWSELSGHDVINMAQVLEGYGIEAIVYTDIGRDGMMQGVNVEATASLARAISIPVIASGGISRLDDLRALCEVKEEGIMGAIIGRALYQGDIDLVAAQTLVNSLG